MIYDTLENLSRCSGIAPEAVKALLKTLPEFSASPRKNSINGIAIYCEWEMNENKWSVWRKFIR